MLVELARLTALDEGSPQAFKVRAYENAIAGIEAHPGDLIGLGKAELTQIKGVGSATADKILELETTGRVAKLEDLRQMYPPAFVELTRIPGLGPKTLKRLRAEVIEQTPGKKRAFARPEDDRKDGGKGQPEQVPGIPRSPEHLQRAASVGASCDQRQSILE